MHALALTNTTLNACDVQLGAYGGFQQDIDSLKRDKNMLMMELVRLRQNQAVSRCSLLRHAVLR
mgnify:CR=1 FL=1